MFFVMWHLLFGYQQVQVFTVKDVHADSVSCMHWSRNAMKLFTGDIKGRVVCTEIDYTMVCWLCMLPP